MSTRYTVKREAYTPIIDELQRSCLPGDEPVADALLNLYWVVRTDAGAPVAFIIMYQHSDCWYLKRAGTLPAHEGNRLYPRMLRAAFKAMRKAGITLCVTDTANWNVRSGNGLIRAGFRMYTPQQKWGWDDGLYWRIDLAPHQKRQR